MINKIDTVLLHYGLWVALGLATHFSFLPLNLLTTSSAPIGVELSY